MRSEAAGPALLLAGAAALLAGAYGFELIGGLVPCEMCWWQRWALFAVLFLAADALLLGRVATRAPAPASALATVARATGWA
ncbi:disulfide bond formation protein B, partial [Sandarakinorhabdus rubra]|uniref:disulfide bond formation protein B n=1 Tax=Sandarakinorhabdus rubra TaxID=2672568 RepID=UPI0013DC8C36